MGKPLTERFADIESDPEFQELDRMTRKKIRDSWVKTRMSRVGPISPEEKEAFTTQLMDEAYAGAEEWQKPQKPPEMPGVGTAVLSGLEAVGRVVRAPQQLVANILAGAGKGPEKGESWWYPAVRPLAQTWQTMNPDFGAALRLEPPKREDRPPQELVGGEFTEQLTDPLMWTTLGGLGVAKVLSTKTAPEIVKMAMTNPRLAALLKMPGVGATRKMVARSTKPISAEALKNVPGSLIPKFTEMTPEGQTLYKEVTAAPLTRKTVAQSLVPEYGRSYVASTPEQRTAMSGLRATPQGERSLETWLSQPPHLRKSLVKPGTREYVTEFGVGPTPRSVVERVTLGEGLPTPGETLSTFEAFDQQISGAKEMTGRALALPPAISKKLKKAPKKVKEETINAPD